MRELRHEDIELAVAEAATGDRALDAEILGHLASCESCAALRQALGSLQRMASETEPDEASWIRFRASLAARLQPAVAELGPARDTARDTALDAARDTALDAARDTALDAARARRRRGLRAVLALAAGLGAVALALWALAPGSEDPATEVAGPSGRTAVSVIAAASEDSLETGLMSLGLTTTWDDDDADAGVDSAIPEGLAAPLAPAPAWGDSLGMLEDELGLLSDAEQDDLARALREAT